MLRMTVIVLGLLFISPVLGQTEEFFMEQLEVRSSAFEDRGSIPSDFTCDGADRSPPIAWSGVPTQTQSLVIVAEDPDAPAGDWVHWLVYDLPPSLTQLPAGIPKDEKLSMGGLQGKNDFGAIGYGGPCPPSGTHRYAFMVYALDTMLHLKPGATKRDLLKTMEGRVLAEGMLRGTYKRS